MESVHSNRLKQKTDEPFTGPSVKDFQNLKVWKPDYLAG